MSVITNVGLDHTAQLGDTLEEIAFQKAGIIKRGVPVVSGVTQDGPREVIRRIAAEMDAPLLGTRFVRAGSPPRTLGLLGQHQVANAAVARRGHRAASRRRGCRSPIRAIARGLADVRWPARDRTHCRASGRHSRHRAQRPERRGAGADTLRESFPVPGVKRVVFAVSSDKQYPEMLRLLAGYFDHFHLTRYGNNPALRPARATRGHARRKCLLGRHSPFMERAAEAWQAAGSASKPDDLICITGSVFLAGELRRFLIPISS